MTETGITVTQDQAQYLAKLVHEHVYPAEYHRVHIDNGRRFEVTVKLYVTPEDTQPMTPARRNDE